MANNGSNARATRFLVIEGPGFIEPPPSPLPTPNKSVGAGACELAYNEHKIKASRSRRTVIGPSTRFLTSRMSSFFLCIPAVLTEWAMMLVLIDRFRGVYATEFWVT